MTFVKRTTVMTVGVGDLYSSSGFWRYSEVDVQGLLSISQLEKVILLYINNFRKKWWSVTRRFFSLNKHGVWGGTKTRGRLWKVSENSIRGPLNNKNFVKRVILGMDHYDHYFFEDYYRATAVILLIIASDRSYHRFYQCNFTCSVESLLIVNA